MEETWGDAFTLFNLRNDGGVITHPTHDRDVIQPSYLDSRKALTVQRPSPVLHAAKGEVRHQPSSVIPLVVLDDASSPRRTGSKLFAKQKTPCPVEPKTGFEGVELDMETRRRRNVTSGSGGGAAAWRMSDLQLWRRCARRSGFKLFNNAWNYFQPLPGAIASDTLDNHFIKHCNHFMDHGPTCCIHHWSARLRLLKTLLKSFGGVSCCCVWSAPTSTFFLPSLSRSVIFSAQMARTLPATLSAPVRY